MHIPRQSDGSRAPRAEQLDGAAELRARRRHLVTQLRGVGYWQRLVQARTDLQVAGLLYSAPVPTAVAAACWSVGAAGDDDDDLTVLAGPPEGVDVEGLLGGASAHGPGGQLDRLRQVSLVLLRRSRVLQEELDQVTVALHESLALDGADQAAGDGKEDLGSAAPVPAGTP